MDTKTKKVKIPYAKYPNNGFLLDFAVKSLSIKQDSSFNKIYQRFIKEENISADEYHDTLDTIISDIVYLFDKESEENSFIELFIKEFLKYLILLKTTNSTYRYLQKQLDFIMVIDIFIPMSLFLLQYDKKLVTIDLIPSYNKNSIQKLFEIIESDLVDESKDIKILLSELLNEEKIVGYDSINKNIKNWLSGKSMPDNDHIELLTKLASNTNNFSTNELNTYFLIAKVMQYLYDKSINYFGVKINDYFIEYIQLAMMQIPFLFNSVTYKEYKESLFGLRFAEDNVLVNYSQESLYLNYSLYVSIIQNENQKNSKEFRQLVEDKFVLQKMLLDLSNTPLINKVDSGSEYSKLLESLYTKTSPSQIKTLEDEKRLLRDLESFAVIYRTSEDPYFSFYYARYYAQKREYKQATQLYLTAMKYGKNCMGQHIKSIIKEGLIVSAQDTKANQVDLINAKNNFTKFYKEAYFYKLIDDLPKDINQIFLNDMKKQFDIYYTNLFPNTEEGNTHVISPNFRGRDMNNIKIDFNKPNKLIRKGFPNPITQLMYCAREGDFNSVKRLVDNGADVNFLKQSDNASALIVVLQRIEMNIMMQYTNNVEFIKIAKFLVERMSTDSLNSKLIKKQSSALSLAIQYGLVEIVDSLIKHGVTLDQKNLTTDQLDPLYMSIVCIKLSKQDELDLSLSNVSEEVKKNFYKSMNIFGNAIFDEELEQQSKKIIATLKSGGLNKVFGKQYMKIMQNSQKNHYKVFDLILQHTKDINASSHNRMTALMYAAELNEEYVVRKLLESGADPNNNTFCKHTPAVQSPLL